MDLLRRLFGKRAEPQPEPSPQPALEPEPADFDAAGVLLDLADRRDVDQVLRGLDVHLERIQAQGQEPGVVHLLRWAEEELHRMPNPQPAQYALLGNVCQRLHSDRGGATYLRALNFYNIALEGYRTAREGEGVAVVLNNMGLAYAGLAQQNSGYFRRAIPLLEEALQFYEQGDDWPRRGDICLSLGEAYAGLEESGIDRYELGREYLERAWALYERSGDTGGQAQAQAQLGNVQMDLVLYGQDQALEKAVRHYRNALAIFVDLGDGLSTAQYQERLSQAYGCLGEAEHLRKSLRAAQRARELYAQHGSKSDLAGASLGLGKVHLALAQLGAEEDLMPAFEHLRQALNLYRESGDRPGRGQCLQELAQVYLCGDGERQDADIRQTLSCLEEALAIYRLEGLNAEAARIESQLEEVRDAGEGQG